MDVRAWCRRMAAATLICGAILALRPVSAHQEATGTRPAGSRLLQQSVKVMSRLTGLRGDGILDQHVLAPASYARYHLAGDCVRQGGSWITRFRLTGGQTRPSSHIDAQYTIVFPAGAGAPRIWKRPAGVRAAAWRRDDSDHTALEGGSLCPSTMIQLLRGTYPRHSVNLGVQPMHGHACWHLHSSDPDAVEPGVVTISDFWLDRSSLRWIRVRQVRGQAPGAPTSRSAGYTRSDFHYARFNTPVRISVPAGSTR